MGTRNSIELTVKRWSAWTPNLATIAEWQDWAQGAQSPDRAEKPDVRFVPALLRRRLSSLSRMAFRVATEVLSDEGPPEAYIFCSRYGEYNRTYGILNNLAEMEASTSAAFSMSVHNTAASLLSIHCKDMSPNSTVAGGAATLEVSFLEAWSLLASQEADSVLLVYHDEPLPTLYSPQKKSIKQALAIALFLQPMGVGVGQDRLRLEWCRSRAGASVPNDQNHKALEVVRLLLQGNGTVEVGAERLDWRWSKDIAQV